jgi:hypothetical protein
MNSTVTLPWVAVLAVFIAGIVVGWLAAKNLGLNVSVGGRLIPKTDLAAAGGSHGFLKTTRTFRRKLVLKCQCGAVWQFADGTGPFPPGTEPLPTGDSFICNNCGRSIDLKAERRLEAEALQDVNPGNVN